jgi:hypothetical protein
MKLLIVEDCDAFRTSIRLWIAEQAHDAVPNVLEAATLQDALSVVRNQCVDGVLSDDAFPPDWGDGMGDPLKWHESSTILKGECAARGVPFALLASNAFTKLLTARSAIERALSMGAVHEKRQH